MSLNLTFAHINVRSLIPSLENLKNFISTQNFDIIGVSETWLYGAISTNNVKIEGYGFVRQDREGRGGGVGLYIKNCYKYTLIENEFTRNESFEQVWIRVLLRKVSFIFGCVYRPPSCKFSDFLIHFDNVLTSITPLSDKLCCGGDFNIDYLRILSNDVTEFNFLLENVGLVQTISTPTRITDTSSTLIDLVLISNDLVLVNSDTLHALNLSDHEFIFCEFSLPKQGREIKYLELRDIKGINMQQFADDLRSIPWRNIFDIYTVNEKVAFINDNLNALLDLHAPFKKIRITKDFQPWLENVRDLMKLRDKALSRYKRNRTDTNREYYKSLRNLTNLTINNEKKAYLNAKLSTSKNVWQDLKKYCSGIKKNKIELPETLKQPNEINNFFMASIPQAYVNNEDLIKHYTNNIKDKVNSFLKFKPESEINILNVITEIKSNASGIDGLNINIINLCCPFILPYLTHLINFCLINSVYPDEWKRALVTPLPKINDPQEYKDLRPISVLPCLSKVLEKIINKQLTEHVERNQILPVTQSGFRRHHGCSTALSNVTDDILRATDAGRVTILALLDFSKAFDTLNHKILLAILHFIGLSEEAVNFFENFLIGRSQRVKIDKTVSTELPITSGVPQGSVVSPLLYAIYTSNIDNIIKNSNAQYYADDTQIYLSFKKEDVFESCQKMNNDLESLRSFSLNHSLFLNPKKCCLMLFGPKNDVNSVNNHVNVKVGDTILEIKNNVRNLGLTFDNLLRFDQHISGCMQRAYIRLKLLYSSRHDLSPKLKKLLCDSLVLSIFNHADVVYGDCLTQVQKDRIQKVQNSCLRLIYGIRKFERISHKLREANWLNMESRRKVHSACFYHRVIYYNTPPYLHDKIVYRSHVHNINIRSKGLITPPMHKTKLFERSFTYNIANLYNSLPIYLKQMPPLKFRGRICKYYFDRQYV